MFPKRWVRAQREPNETTRATCSSQEETLFAARCVAVSNMDSMMRVGGRSHDRHAVGDSCHSTHPAVEGATNVTIVPNVEAHIAGTVWKIECVVGDTIAEGDTVVVLESMKMEMPIEAEAAGTVTEIRCREGQPVKDGDVLVVLSN